jgi:hypothetical protein
MEVVLGLPDGQTAGALSRSSLSRNSSSSSLSRIESRSNLFFSSGGASTSTGGGTPRVGTPNIPIPGAGEGGAGNSSNSLYRKASSHVAEGGGGSLNFSMTGAAAITSNSIKGGVLILYHQAICQLPQKVEEMWM